MKKLPRAALICAGNLGDSPISRFRGLSERLGPVKSSSPRLASRYVNSLRAGVAVADYDAMRDCRLVLISVTDAAVPGIVRELAQSDAPWQRKSVLLCSNALESSALCSLEEKGAKTASLCAVAGFDGTMFLAEGDRSVVAQIRPFLGSPGVRLLTVAHGHKMFYLAATACTGPFLTTLLTCAEECLRLAELGSADAADLLRVQAVKNIRGFLKARRRTQRDATGGDTHYAALRKRNPELADYLQQYASLTARLIK